LCKKKEKKEDRSFSPSGRERNIPVRRPSQWDKRKKKREGETPLRAIEEEEKKEKKKEGTCFFQSVVRYGGVGKKEEEKERGSPNQKPQKE